MVGLSTTYARAETETPIEVLFGRWKPLIAKLDLWEQDMQAASDLALANYPDVPAMLRFENVPEWRAYLSN